MQKIGFAEAVDRIIAEDPRYHRDVYAFVRDALDFTVKQQKKIKEGVPISPILLVGGIRDYLVIGDGYHRASAACWVDEDALVPGRLLWLS